MTCLMSPTTEDTMTTTTFHLAELVMFRDDCVEMAIAAEEDGEYRFAELYIHIAEEVATRIHRQEMNRGAKGIPSILV